MDPSSLRLSEARESEIDTLSDYIAELYQQSDELESLVNIQDGVQTLMRQPSLATAYFIMKGSDRIGYVILTRYLSVKKGGLVFFIDELFVDPEYRKKGVGSKILEEVVAIARDRGARVLWVQVEPQNESAIRFFTHRGFKEILPKHFEYPL